MIYTEHEETDANGLLRLVDGPKETLVDRWKAALEDTSITVLQPAEVMSATPAPHGFDVVLVENGSPRTVRTQKVILAAGKRGEVNRLEVPAETCLTFTMPSMLRKRTQAKRCSSSVGATPPSRRPCSLSVPEHTSPSATEAHPSIDQTHRIVPSSRPSSVMGNSASFERRWWTRSNRMW